MGRCLGKINVVMYTNEWCHACKHARELAKGLPIEERDIEEHMDFCISNGLTLVPSFAIFDGETLIKKYAGYLEKQELLEFIKD